MKISDIRHTIYHPVPLDTVVRGALLNALAYTNGNQREAAKLLEMEPRTLHYQLGVYGIPRSRTDTAKRKTAAVLLALLCWAGVASAQSPITAGRSLQWDMENTAPDFAQGVTYTLYQDAAVTGDVLVNVQCVAHPTIGNAAQCTVALPPLTSGKHALAVTAKLDTTESGKSTELLLLFGVIHDPTHLRID